MSTQEQIKLNVLGQYIKDLSFEVPYAPDCFNRNHERFFNNTGKSDNSSADVSGMQVQYDTNVSVDMLQNSLGVEEEGMEFYEVSLKVTVKVTNGLGIIAYISDIEYACTIGIANIAPNQVQRFLHTYVPHQFLFPITRALTSNSVLHGGFPPIALAPVDFDDLYDKRMQGSSNNVQTETV